MSLSDQHPLYVKRKPDWDQMRDTYAGERTVKDAGTTYLPATSGMVEDGFPSTGTKGWKDYVSYRTRARCPDLVDEAVSALLGVMHSKPPVIELPQALEYLREAASVRGESLEMVLKRINLEQMVAGRLGILGDVVDVGEKAGQFYLAVYTAESAINWDTAARSPLEIESLNLVVLDETTQRRSGDFSWQTQEQWRVLMLGGLDTLDADNSGAVYSAGVFTEKTEFNPAAMKVLNVRGRTLNEIPFVFINGEDIVAEPGKPPLLGLSNLQLTIYRGEADYRQSLFMQGQDTLVRIGGSADPNGSETTRVGIGAVIDIPLTGDAKFIGVDSQGLPEQRKALDSDYGRGEQFAGRLMDSATRERESGDALRIRLATRTATLNQIAEAGAYGLQTILRKLARWIGADPEQVIVTPNMDFVDDQMTGDQLRSLVEAKNEGAPVSYETVHRVMEQRSMTEMSFEEELAKIKAEAEIEKMLKPEPEPAPAAPGNREPDTETEEPE